jgi:hypothetical protein
VLLWGLIRNPPMNSRCSCRMAKAGTPKRVKPKPKTSNKEQTELFKETARKLGVDESGKEFERAFVKVISKAQTDEE